jgi:hypothetical protein
MEVSGNTWDFMTIAQNGSFQKHLGFHDYSAEWKFPETPGIS